MKDIAVIKRKIGWLVWDIKDLEQDIQSAKEKKLSLIQIQYLERDVERLKDKLDILMWVLDEGE